MKSILFLICAFALFSAGFVSVAHAHVEQQNTDQQIELSIDQGNKLDNKENKSHSDALCDMHCHNHMAQENFTQKYLLKITSKRLFVLSDDVASSLVYGLKRPPKL